MRRLSNATAFFRLLLAVGFGLTCVPVSADLVEAIARVKPSVVMVGVFRPNGSPQFSLLGTGFIVGDGRMVATNAHVVAEAEAKMSGVPSSETVRLVVATAGTSPVAPRAQPAQLHSVDKVHDLAILRLAGESLPAVSLGDSNRIREGQAVAFTGFPIGNALGFVPVTHRGIISAVTPIVLPSANARQLGAAAVRGLRAGAFDIFQLDGTAYPGNSGGPLFNADNGEVVGIVNMVVVKGTKESALSRPSGISYAVPVEFLRVLMGAN